MRVRSSVALEINDSDLYASLRKAVDAVPDPELRKELKSDPWKSLQERYPVSNSFMDAMAEIQEQKRISRRNARVITLLGFAVGGTFAVIARANRWPCAPASGSDRP